MANPEIAANQSRTYLVVGMITLAVALIYISQWLQMPLYSDEVAFRLLKGRYLADGSSDFSIFPCADNGRKIPIVFRPFAYALSVADRTWRWSLVRLVPLAGVVLVLTAALAIILKRQSPSIAPILAAGSIGVAGSGLILSRGEVPMFFLGFVCLMGFVLVSRRCIPVGLSGLYLLIASAIAMLAFFVHVQTVIWAPLLALTAVALILRSTSLVLKSLAACMLMLTLVGASTSVSNGLTCPEYPAIELRNTKSEVFGLARTEGLQGAQTYLQEKLPRFSQKFLFKAIYDENYLPGVESAASSKSIALLNDSISAVVFANLLVAAITALFCAISIVAALREPIPVRSRLTALATKPSTYLFFGLAGHLALFVDDVPTTFYRSFHIHFMLVIMNCLALTEIRPAFRTLLWPVSLASLAISVASAVVAHADMDAKFKAGWQGAFIKLDTDWGAVREAVRQVADRCNISKGAERIVIDDLTYDALKDHRHLIPITYLSFALPDRTGSVVGLLSRINATGAVTRCNFMRSVGLIPVHEQGEICCAKFGA